MIELLQAQVELARAMASLRSLSPEERTEWRKFHAVASAQLERLVTPPRTRPQPPPIPTRP